MNNDPTTPMTNDLKTDPREREIILPRWDLMCCQSGTQNVQHRKGGAWYHIGHLAADTEGDAGRYDTGKELEIWLNGGEEPWWLDLLERTAPDTARTPHGAHIRATGPMIDVAEPPGWGIWKEDDSPDGQIQRGLLIEALCKKRRPQNHPPKL